MIMRLRANDYRIKLGENIPSTKREIKPISRELKAEIKQIEEDSKKRSLDIKQKRKVQIKACGKDKDLKKQCEQQLKEELRNENVSSLRLQAEAFAKANDETLPADLSEEDLRKIHYRFQLPSATRSEEHLSSISHIVGAGIAFVLFILGIVFASVSPNPGNDSSRAEVILGMVIFGLGSIVLYTVSAIYHFLYVNKAKKVFRILDHSAIYILIASSYTPFCLLGALYGAYGSNSNLWGYVLLGIEWCLSAILIVCNCLWLQSKPVLIFTTLGYVVLGWAALAFVPALYANLTLGGFLLLLFGGVFYTIGAVLFALGPKVRYLHGIAHITYIFGTLLHFFALLFYLIY